MTDATPQEGGGSKKPKPPKSSKIVPRKELKAPSPKKTKQPKVAGEANGSETPALPPPKLEPEIAAAMQEQAKTTDAADEQQVEQEADAEAAAQVEQTKANMPLTDAAIEAKEKSLTEEVEQPISKRFMTGDLVKLCMREIADLQVPFATLTDASREQVKSRVTEAVKRAVRQACEHIATSERPAVHARVDSVTFKEGIKVVLDLSKSQRDRHAIADAQGDTVLLVLADYAFVDGAKPEQTTLL